MDSILLFMVFVITPSTDAVKAPGGLIHSGILTYRLIVFTRFETILISEGKYFF